MPRNANSVLLEKFLSTLLYNNLEQFISLYVCPESEDENVRKQRESLLKKALPIIKKRAKKAVAELKKKGIASIGSITQNTKVVENLMTSIQKDMESDASRLSKN